MPSGMEELEVVGLKEFLDAMAPEVDPAFVARCLHVCLMPCITPEKLLGACMHV
jgi:hypothetical protein